MMKTGYHTHEKRVSTLCVFTVKNIILVSFIIGMGLTGAGSASASESICYACHYGDFLDKGGSCTLWMDHGHPVYVKPSDKIVIPKGFTLDEKGKMFCGTCHSLTIKSVEVIKKPWSYSDKLGLVANNSDSYMCKLCHVKMLKKGEGREERRINNHPVGVVVERPSRVLVESGGKFGTSDTLVICETCHAVHGSREKKLLVMKNEQGQLCSQCHAKANAFSLEQARERHIHPINILPRKAFLSKKLRSSGAGTDQQGRITCNTCHRLHNPPVKKYLLLTSNENSRLCTECHAGKLKNLLGTGHDFNVSAPQARNVNQKTVRETGVCGPCHLTHTGKKAKITGQRDAARYRDRISRLCSSCHQKEGMAKSKLLGDFSHPVGIFRKKGKNDRLPLFSREGDLVTDGLITCVTCHDPHRDSPEGEKSFSPKNYFLRISNRKSELCKQCHSRKQTIVGTPHDLAASLKEKNQVPPLAPGLKEQAGVCGQCHAAHNAASLWLWNRQLPDDEEGADTISRICLSCHRDNMIAGKHQIGRYSHPTGVEVDPTAAAGLPLFDDQYRPAESGKVYCATCHDIHQWAPGQNKSLEKPAGEGNRNNSFLRVTVSTGHLCGRCHPRQNRSVSGTRHDLRVSAPRETDLGGLTAGESGVCGSCHQVHNGSGVRMWAKRLEGKGDIISDLCSSCHQPGKVAGKKPVGEFSHPVGVTNPEKSSLPLYSKAGKKMKEGGLLSCLTCHNAHPRKSQDRQFGGNFLRAAYTREKVTLCSLCHKEEGWIFKTDHDLRITAPQTENARGKVPGDTPLCQTCHAVHRARTAFRLWNRSPGKGDDRISRLCNSCHSSGKSADSKIITGDSHLLGVDLLETVKGMDSFKLGLPVYDDDYRKVKLSPEEGKDPPSAGRVYCATCHQVHKWRADRETFGSGRNEEGDNSSSFLRKSNFPKPELCGQCHPDQSLIAGSSHDLTVSLPEYRNIEGRAPSESGVCGSCHQTHHPRSVKRFRTENPDESKDDVISQYCGSCHQEGGAAEGLVIKKNSHPIGLKVAKQLNNELPLYFKNGERNDREGRITCYTCHDIHRRFSKPGAEKAAGKNFDFLRTVYQGSPELCGNCHPEETKIADTPHDLTSKPPWRNTLVCYACHRTHNAGLRKNLWAGKLGPRILPGWTEGFAKEKNIDVQRCTGCHSQGAIASGALPRYGLHKPGLPFIQKIVKKIPLDFPYPVYVFKDRDKRVTLTSTAIIKGLPGFYPLYAQNGNPSLKGNVTCSTCHDVHVWSGKPPLDRNSDYRNNFLRKNIAGYFCADCHGLDSLPLLAYFHISRTIKPVEETGKTLKVAHALKKVAGKFADGVKKTAAAAAAKIKELVVRAKNITRKLIYKKQNSKQMEQDEKDQAKTADKLPSPHWKDKKIGEDCGNCHNQQTGFRNKHPLSMLSTDRSKYKVPEENSQNIKKRTCLLCHDPLLASENKSRDREINPYFLKKYKIKYDFQKHKYDKTSDFSMVPDTDFIVHLTSGNELENVNSEDSHIKGDVDQRKVESQTKSIYNICYQCHKIGYFLQFNPHMNQRKYDGSLNREVCLYCHYKIPSPKASRPKYFNLKHPLEKLCLGCHPQTETSHPSRVTHFKKTLNGEYLIQMQSYMAGAPNKAYFPMEEGRVMVCSTCHNPHQWGATSLPKTQIGANSKFRLRTDRLSICPVCHTETMRRMIEDDRVFW